MNHYNPRLYIEQLQAAAHVQTNEAGEVIPLVTKLLGAVTIDSNYTATGGSGTFKNAGAANILAGAAAIHITATQL